VAVAHRIYAEALLGAAKDRGSVARVREEFDDFMAAFAQSRELRNLMLNPQIDPRAKRDALTDVLGEADASFRSFIRLLADKNRIAELEAVYAEWQELLAREDRIVKLELTTAIELSDEEAAAIVRQIEEAAGRRVEAERSVDPSLIGGLVLQAGSLRVDASVRGRLNQLRQELVTRS
jgi:F-type H+-transporting ATPase subunit delta